MLNGRRCTAHSKRTGAPCGHLAMQGQQVCHMHGGKTPRGLAAPSWQHGRYSKALPAGLGAAYERARTDGELIALRDELALVDARLTALLESLTSGGGAEAWERLSAAWRRLERAPTGDAGQLERAAALRVIHDLIVAGAAEASVWSEVYDALELRRRLADTERKRLEALRATITAQEAMALIGTLAASVKRHVTDRAALAAITADLERALPQGGARAAS